MEETVKINKLTNFARILKVSLKKKKKIVFAVISDLVTDQRVHKMASTLAENGYEVTVIGRKKKDSLELSQNLPYSTKRFSCWFTKGKWFYIEFQIKMFFHLLFSKANLITSNDLDTLLPCYLASKLKWIPVLYDSHEYFTETPELIHRPWTRRIWLNLEQFLIPKLPMAITINHSLSKIYQEKYQIPFEPIYNVPVFSPSEEKMKMNEKILIYQGALNVGRGIELMIETMKILPDYKLWIVGKGDIEEKLKNLSKNLKNVKFWGAVPFQQLAGITSIASIGLSLEEDLGENYRVATPNKVFDYIHAEIPVIVSNLPGLRSIVEMYQIGIVNQEFTPESLAQNIKRLEEINLYRNFIVQCKIAKQNFCWQNQTSKLLEIYQKLIP